MIKGNVEGIRDSILKELNDIYDMNIEKGKIVSQEILMLISTISKNINREISVSLDRKGKVLEVAIGDSNSVELPILDISNKKLSGVRVIHTHPNGTSNLSMIDISALLKLKLDLIVAIGLSGEKLDFNIGYCKVKNQELSYEELKNLTLNDILKIEYLNKVSEIEESLKKNDVIEDEMERAILVGVDSQESLDELEELAKACDVLVNGRIFQKIKRIDNIFYIGSGKVKELSMLCQIKNSNLIIFDEELSGIQIKNLEAVTGCKVIDRTILILEIFARRAKTREAKIQVELAQLKYRSQRLIGLGSIMSRTGGGIGTKGPGEKKLEIDRRRIKDEIFELKQELDKIKQIRNIQRNKRENSRISKISLVGYTNVGKSTLRNLLVKLYPSDNTIKKDGVFAENMLFATLDATTRTIILPDKRLVALTDTVGFVRKLPHDLIEAFKSTLEEVIYSDMLIHLVDASNPTVFAQIESVEKVLEELNAINKKIILVLNKCDMATESQLEEINKKFMNSIKVEISAKNSKNIEELMEVVAKNLPVISKTVKFLIPYTDTFLNAYLHRNAVIQKETYENDGTKIIAIVNEEIYNKYKSFIVEEL